MGTKSSARQAIGSEQRTRDVLRCCAPLCMLMCAVIACTVTVTTPNARADGPTEGALPVRSSPPTLPPSTAVVAPTAAVPASGLVITVLATDVALWQAPDIRSGNVTVSFMLNGATITASVYVSGELPVLETDLVGMDGATRWTRVQYSGYAGPLVGGTAFTATGYLRNDLISTPHAPGTPAVRNP